MSLTDYANNIRNYSDFTVTDLDINDVEEAVDDYKLDPINVQPIDVISTSEPFDSEEQPLTGNKTPSL